jgi:hypothetical protein
MDYRNLLPLDSFLNSVFLPALGRCSRQEGRADYDAILARLILFESVGWLSVGVDFGIFAREMAQALCTQYFPLLYEQYKLFPSDLAYIIRDDQRNRIQSALEKGILAPARPPNGDLRPELISGRLQLILGLVANLNRDQATRSLCDAILLLGNEGWARIAEGAGGDAIVAAIQGRTDVWIDGNRGFVYAGVFNAIRHIEGVLELLDYRQRGESIDLSVWATLRQTVYDVHRWRFDLENERYYERFTQLATGIIRALKSETSGGREVDSGAFLDYIGDLKKRWRALEGLVASASS